MVFGSRHDYGSCVSADTTVNSSSQGVGVGSSRMEDSETLLQSRPLLHAYDDSTANDWRHISPARGAAGGAAEVAATSTGTSAAVNRHHRLASASYLPVGASLMSPVADTVLDLVSPTAAGDSLCGSGSGVVNGTTELVHINVTAPVPPRYPKEKMKTFIAFLWLLFNFLLTLTSLALTHERVPNIAPLPDVVLDTVPTAGWPLTGSEIIIMIMFYVALITVLLHKHRFIVFRRIFLIMGLLYMMRSLTYFVTVLPKPDPRYPCAPKAGVNLTAAVVVTRVFKLMTGFGLSINGQHVYCGDYIYSGHTVTLTMGYLVIREYSPRHWWPLHWCSMLLAAVGVVMVLVSRGHYTIDVLLAYYVTSRLFWIYHVMANNTYLKEPGGNNYLSRLWWHRLFVYFECNVAGSLPRHYQWPLAWPRCIVAALDKRPERIS